MLGAIFETVFMAGVANVTGQFLLARQLNRTAGSAQPHTLDVMSMLHLMAYALVAAPPNILWQERLESAFPTSVTASVKENQRRSGTSYKNLILKVILDQAVGAFLNNAFFLIFMKALQGMPWNQLATQITQDLWPITKSGWAIWPIFSLAAFAFLEPRQRAPVFVLITVSIGNSI